MPQLAPMEKTQQVDQSATKTRICLLGASFETNNMGVNVLAEASVKCILTRWPDAEITLLESGRKKGQYRLNLMDREITVISLPLRFSKNILSSGHFIILSLYAILLKLLPFKWFKKKAANKNAYVNLLLHAHLVADITAGDSFSDIYGMRRFLISFLRKWLVIQFNRKLVMLPQTYGPFRWSSVRYMARYVLRHAAVVYCRDRTGVDYVRNLICSEDTKVRFAPDVGFVLDARRPGRIYLGSPAGTKDRDTTLIGLNVSGLLFNADCPKYRAFGLKADYRNVVNGIIDLLMAKPHTSILLIPHVFAAVGYVESDIQACLQVYFHTARHYQDRIFLAYGEYDQNEIKHIIGMTDFFIGSRMHSCIAAMSQCIPTVGLAYSKKFHGVFESVAMEQFVADMRQYSQKQILETTDHAFRQRRLIAEKLDSVIPQVKKTVLNMFEDVP